MPSGQQAVLRSHSLQCLIAISSHPMRISTLATFTQAWGRRFLYVPVTSIYVCPLETMFEEHQPVQGLSASSSLKPCSHTSAKPLKAFHSSERQETMTATGFQQIREQTELLRRQNYIRTSGNIMPTTAL